MRIQSWVAAAFGLTMMSAAVPAADLEASQRGAVAYGPAMALACEDGRTYPIRARAVSDVGDLVTGYLVTAPGHNVYIRLMPMGDGYRYSGRGIWFDGIRSEAVLFLGRAPVSCTVTYG
jgi:hypothetical protein